MSLHRTHRRRSADEAGVDMTPMLDIVFIMLIFFIVTATFLDEQGIDFTQPPDETTSPAPPVKAIAVYVNDKDQVTVNEQVTELSAVSLRVERLLAENPKAQISLRANYHATLDPIVYIKDQMNLAGLETVIKIDRPAEDNG